MKMLKWLKDTCQGTRKEGAQSKGNRETYTEVPWTLWPNTKLNMLGTRLWEA